MCDPVTGSITIASTIAAVSSPTAIAALSAVSTGAGLVGQINSANAQEAANKAAYKNSLVARADNYNQLNLRRAQEAEAAGQKVSQNNIALRESQAAAIAQAGPSGLSVDALLGEMARKGAGYNDSVNQNLDRVNMALDSQLTNVNRSAASEINSLKAPDMPDYLGAALRIGETAQTYRKKT